MAATWSIEFFESIKGDVPARDYLLTLDQDEQVRFRKRLEILSDKGLASRYPISEKLEDNLYELRLANSTHNPRFLYCASVGRVLYILHGFSKTGQNNDKVPESEKIIARRRRKELEERLKEEAEETVKQVKTKPKKKRR
jgi:phage-related protein